MNYVSGYQKYSTIFSFTIFFYLIEKLYQSVFSLLFANVNLVTNGALSININNADGLYTTILYFINLFFRYFFIIINYIVVIFLVINIIKGIINFISNKSFSIYFTLSILGNILVIFGLLYEKIILLLLALIIGIALFDQTYLLQSSLYQPFNFNNIINDYKALFINFSNKDNDPYNPLIKFGNRKYYYIGEKDITIVFDILSIVLTVISFGLLSGIGVYIKNNYYYNNVYIKDSKLSYKDKWYIWLFKGIKWTILTILTLGLYYLLGLYKIDSYNQISTCLSFKNNDSNDESFFDGLYSEYMLIHLCKVLLSVISLGFLLPYLNNIEKQYIYNHIVINGHRLIYSFNIKDIYYNIKHSYFIFIVTLGLAGFYYCYIDRCDTSYHLSIDDSPLKYDIQEDIVE